MQTLAGYLSIAFGILWLLKPDLLRWWLLVKSTGILFWLAMGTFFLPLFHFGSKLGFGVILLIVVVLWLGRKALREFLKQALEKVPSAAYQVIGLLSIASGAAMVWFHPAG